MKIIRGNDIKFISVTHEDPKDPGALKKVLFKKEDVPASRIQMINWAKIPAGKASRPHVHETMDEVFIVISGSISMTVGRKTVTVSKGDAVFVSRQEVHGLKNIGAKDVVYIVVGIV